MILTATSFSYGPCGLRLFELLTFREERKKERKKGREKTEREKKRGTKEEKRKKI